MYCKDLLTDRLNENSKIYKELILNISELVLSRNIYLIIVIRVTGPTLSPGLFSMGGLGPQLMYIVLKSPSVTAF